MQFTEFGFCPEVLEALDAMGFIDATPVQAQAIPYILDNRDVLACAQTGTGKTAAFILPVLNHIVTRPQPHIDTLILVPTRELAIQVDQQVEGLSYFTAASSVVIYGGRDGHSMEQEKQALKRGAPIVVATPGRLIAHINMGYVDFSRVKHLILDEADRMLDMGFMPDITSIVNHLPKERQTLLFSATMPPKIRQLAKTIQNKPAEISVAISKPNDGILQAIYEAEDHIKIPLIMSLLDKTVHDDKKVIIFSGSKKNVKDLAMTLQAKGLKVGSIHSDLEQAHREEQLRAFASGNTNILVATDILARGIDIKGIELVLNYEVPADAEDYVHRIGRTGRADATGVAITLMNRKDYRRLKRIEELIEKPIQRIPLPPHLATMQQQAPPADSRDRFGDRRTGRGKGGPFKGHKTGKPRSEGGPSQNTNSRNPKPGGRSGGGQNRKPNPANRPTD